MNRMTRVFTEMKERGEKVNVLYFPVGDPALGDSVELAETYYNAGCTVLEIGLPYEEPYLDGKTVRDSMERALTAVDLEEVFGILKAIRKKCPDKIMQVMTYYGNIEKYGIKRFAEIMSEIGIDAVLTPDAAKEKIAELDAELGNYDIIHLRFMPYSLKEEDLEDCRTHAKGYIFSQAVNGGTGTQTSVDPHVAENIKLLRDCGAQALIVPGFGISDAVQAKEVLDMGADGFVIGSAILSHFLNGDGEDFIRSIREVCLAV